ncbi:MAG TPA: hypothetical protein PKD91_07185 [Bacteroidia bacterium]|nr:hypothetical protein [Bacteroidia bacterium]
MKINYLPALFTVCLILACSFASDAQINQDTVYTKDPRDKDLILMEVFDDHHQLIASGRMLKGKKEGLYRQYNAKYTIMFLQEFHNGIPDGIYLRFSDNGAIDLEENYKEGLLDGKRIQYRFGSIKRSVENFKNGKLEGEKIVYYDSGFKQEEANYKNGLREGVSTWFNQSEIMTIQYTYKAGIMDGPAKTFFFNSQVQTEGLYVNDQESGEWKHYDETGKHIKSVFYENGKISKEVTY